jgi:TIR domain
MASKIFISYRRDDSAGSAGRIHDRLRQELGRDDLLFMDVDAITLGANFVRVLREEVSKCDVLLALIGPNWLDAKDERGNRRLESANDPVRIEVAAALQREIPVIPILLDGARIPNTDQLPKDLEELAERNGLVVRHASFHNDMGKLIRWLKKRSDPSGAQSPLYKVHWWRKSDRIPSAPSQSDEMQNVGEVKFRIEDDEGRLNEGEAKKRQTIKQQPILGRVFVLALVGAIAALLLYFYSTTGHHQSAVTAETPSSPGYEPIEQWVCYNMHGPAYERCKESNPRPDAP